MGVKETVDWVINEWGIFARRDQMSRDEMMRWLKQWVPFGVRTIGYGTVSLVAGPITPGRAASAWAQRRWSLTSLHRLLIEPKVEGEHHAPSQGGFMYASNHQSLLDILLLGAILPGNIKWASKRSIMNVPFLGWHLRLAGHVPVDRRAGRRAAADTIKRFEQVLREGEPLLVFPEGTRTANGDVQPFKNGGFYAAVRAGVPVVPVAIEGTGRLMSKHAADTGDVEMMRPAYVRIGAPIEPPREGKEKARVALLRDATEAAVRAMHTELRAAIEASSPAVEAPPRQDASADVA